MTTILLTARSKNGVNLDSATPKIFVVDRMGTVQSNLNTNSSQSVTEAGDTASQCSAWAIYGTGQKLYWALAVNSLSSACMTIYADPYHNRKVAYGALAGSSTTSGIIYCTPVNQSGISVNVTVGSATPDGDAANIIQLTNWDAMDDQQLNGTSQFDYTETNGAISKYTVDETYATIQATIAAATSTVTEISGSLSTAQITILNGTPVAAIATPGAGYAIQILGGAISYNYDTAAFSVNTTVDLVNTTTGTIVANAATAVAGTADKVTRFMPVAGLVIANEGISLKMNTGDPTVGAGAVGTCTYTIIYTTYAI